MEKIGLYFFFCIIYFAVGLSIFVLRKKTFREATIKEKAIEKREMIINISFAIISIILLVVVIIPNLDVIVNQDEIVSIIIINSSQFLLISSLVLFYKSVNVIEIEYFNFEIPSKKHSKNGEIYIGRVVQNGKEKYGYHLKLKDLQQHMFITGITGSGKTTFMHNFLTQFTQKFQIPFLLAEFKGEYHFLQRIIPELLILKPGINFALNIFNPEGANAEIHAERVFQIFKSGGLFEGVDYTPQMERVFVDILNIVCRNPNKRSWKDFYGESVKYMKGIESEGMFYKQSVLAVQNRIRRYSLGTLKHIFEENRGLNVKELFDYNVLLDLSSIIKLGGEKEDTLFFLNMFFKYLWDENLEKGSRNYSGIKHMIILEDAQYFASQALSTTSKLTSYIEDVALLLRGTGECLVSLATRPSVSAEILANAGVLISFQNHLQKNYIVELLNLQDEEKKYLSMLQTGECLIRVNSLGKPFVLRTPNTEREWLSEEEINEGNKKVLELIDIKKFLIRLDRIFRKMRDIINKMGNIEIKKGDKEVEENTTLLEKKNEKKERSDIDIANALSIYRESKKSDEIKPKEDSEAKTRNLAIDMRIDTNMKKNITVGGNNYCWKCGIIIKKGEAYCNDCSFTELKEYVNHLYREQKERKTEKGV